jgi:hypothetical protein
MADAIAVPRGTIATTRSAHELNVTSAFALWGAKALAAAGVDVASPACAHSLACLTDVSEELHAPLVDRLHGRHKDQNAPALMLWFA